MNNTFEPKHKKKKVFLKPIGLILLITGIIFMVIAFADFMNAFSNPFSTPPTKFGLFFIGLPFVFIGFTMTSDGFVDEDAL